ncbi:MAG: catalase [Clostridia bacterium]|jgi:hypothetical protein|nr:catalase [Clostridia bacterium]
MKISNLFKHIRLVTRHKWLVFKLACKIGIPWRGFMHDLSKYSPQEFWESVKYYDGRKSPILVCKEAEGYSKAWLHHKGVNKHHFEYWVDTSLPYKAAIMPYKYAAEMICDKIAAGITYNGKDCKADLQLNYYMKEREVSIIHPQIDKFLISVFTELAENGIEKAITKENIKRIYEKHCIRMES